MAKNLTYVSTEGLSFKRDDNGNLIVRGLASDETLDLDKQVCDGGWLATAVPEWSRIGNVREMHGSSAVGKALSIAQEGLGWVVESKIVDPVAAKKVEEGVYTGYSIGIKNATLDKSPQALTKAPNGIINGGQIVEISLVDRPANPSSTLEIVKSVNGEVILGDALKDAFSDQGDTLDGEISISPVAPEVPVNESYRPCNVCNGLGMTSDLNNPKECEHCHGTKVEPEDSVESIDPSVPGHEDPDANYDPDQKGAQIDPADLAITGTHVGGEWTMDLTHLPSGLSTQVTGTDDKAAIAEGMAVLSAQIAKADNEQPGGGYPINNVKQLKDAIQAFGRSKDPTKTKAHIKARAKALGRADLIPDNWSKSVDAEILKWAESLNKGADEGQWLHDPADLQAIRQGLVNCMKAELDELASGEDDELTDLSQLLCSLQMFLCWWDGEAGEDETTEPFKESDDMAFIGMGVSPDLIKRANEADASDETREEFVTEVRKALGVDAVTDLTEKLAGAEETIKGLTERLDNIEKMAAPGGPAKSANVAVPQVSTEAEQLLIKAAHAYRMAESVTEPASKRGFYEDGQRYEREAKSLVR